MISGMTRRYEKIAITLPLRAAEHVRRAVRYGHAPSVSAYIATAVEEKAKKETAREFFDELLAETGGPMTAAERRETERLLFGPPIPWQQQVKDLEKRRALEKRRLEKRRKPAAKRTPRRGR